MPALLFLKQYWKHIAAIICILVVFAYWKSLTMKINSQAKEIVQLTVDLQVVKTNFNTCSEANKQFADLVDEQNLEVQRQAKINEDIVIRYENLAKNFKKIKADNTALILRIDNIPWQDLSCDDQVNACFEVLGGAQ